MFTVFLLSIGDELLLGEIVDTNKPFIAQRLMPLGLTVVGAETVGDEIEDIVAAFQRALKRADIVIATGGLGPTDDDLTNEALAKTLGCELEFRNDVMEQMAARLKRTVTSLPGSNRKQAMLPKGAQVLRNDWGTAPGVHVPVKLTEGAYQVAEVAAATKHVFLTAGVPREMKGILTERIVPFLEAHYPAARALVMKKCHAFGIPESIVGERIKPMMQAGHNPNVGTRVGGGVVTVRLVASAPTEREALELLQPCLAQTREALREGLFAEDDETLASATLAALLWNNKTVAIAESCTGGLVSAMLTEIPGSSAALLECAVVYSNEAKMRTCSVKAETLAVHGAVSAQTAAELASGIRIRAKADFGLSITGIAGPEGGSESKPVGLVYFGIASIAGVRTVERNYPGLDRGMVRDRAAAQALDFLRRTAIGE